MNKLQKEKSSYLLQHADNPVDWFPWSNEAFEIAKQNDKPILLSIGYSACHWCHVMAHESFEDPDIAKIMNENFVNIKLDKEERPDLDKIYQMSQTIITGKTGGWPLTVFMSPDKLPFFAGTYFPPEERYGLPAFKQILERVSEFYDTKKHDIKTQNAQLENIFSNLNDTSEVAVQSNISNTVLENLSNSLDRMHGGFGSAPKFPRCTNIQFILEKEVDITDEIKSLIELSLDRMCFAGIYDHVDGGFFRYSVDEIWMIPHFEKMLYDNGPLVSILSNAYKIYKKDIYLKRAKETCDWIIDNMQDEKGGFYSTVDADSEGEEGKYYVWSSEELKSILNDNENNIFDSVFKIDDKPNFGKFFHLHVPKGKENEYYKNTDVIENIKTKLQKIRNERIPPDTDHKILTSWNCLMIKGLLDIYKVTGDEKYLNSAQKAFSFIKDSLWDGSDLYACYHDKPKFIAYIDDYAFLCDVCLDFIKLEWDDNNFKFLNNLISSCLEDYEDKENGGFFFSSKKNKDLIYRPKTYTDESMPSGNSVILGVFSQLYELTNDNKYKSLMDKILLSARTSITRSPESHCNLLLENMEYFPKKLIIVRSPKEDMVELRNKINMFVRSSDIVLFLNDDISTNIHNIDDKKTENKFSAFICENFTCEQPITEVDVLIDRLNRK